MRLLLAIMFCFGIQVVWGQSHIVLNGDTLAVEIIQKERESIKFKVISDTTNQLRIAPKQRFITIHETVKDTEVRLSRMDLLEVQEENASIPAIHSVLPAGFSKDDLAFRLLG